MFIAGQSGRGLPSNWQERFERVLSDGHGLCFSPPVASSNNGRGGHKRPVQDRQPLQLISVLINPGPVVWRLFRRRYSWLGGKPALAGKQTVGIGTVASDLAHARK